MQPQLLCFIPRYLPFPEGLLSSLIEGEVLVFKQVLGGDISHVHLFLVGGETRGYISNLSFTDKFLFPLFGDKIGLVSRETDPHIDP
jgi:hypothetical protein